MSVLYAFTCDTCGYVESFAPQGARWGTCPECGGEARRRYTPPVTDCHSFGKNQYGARTPEHLRRPRSEDQALAFRDAARAEGTRRQWGPGRTTGT